MLYLACKNERADRSDFRDSDYIEATVFSGCFSSQADVITHPIKPGSYNISDCSGDNSRSLSGASL
jgi:hypothetical protein